MKYEGFEEMQADLHDPPPPPDWHEDGPLRVQKRPMILEWVEDAALTALSEPSRPLISGLLDEGGLTVLYGGSNTGKSWIALGMGFAIATGDMWNGKRTTRGLVIYLAAEGGAKIKRRIAALQKRYLEDLGDRATCAEPQPFALIRHPIDLRSSDANANELLSRIRAAEEERGLKCVLIVIDTLSRAMAGGDENSAVDMGRLVASADRLRSETGAALLYVHHSGKDTARGARGHSLLRAATDTEIEIEPGLLTVTKQRDMEGDYSAAFRLVDVEIGYEPDGTPIRSAVVEWLDAPERGDKVDATDKVPQSQRLLLFILRQAIEEAGADCWPHGHDGPKVRAVSDAIARARFYSRMAEEQIEGDTPTKLANRQRAAWGSARKAAVNAMRVLSGDDPTSGNRVLWLP